MATKQALYDGALAAIGDRKVLTTENTTARRLLDQVYDQVIAECLAAGSWNFAMNTVKVDADTGIEPQFGYKEVFAKPTDFVRTIGISDDEYLSFPLLYYYDDNDQWSADVTPIYVRYVSNDTGLGLDLVSWPALFTRYVELELACRIAPRLTQDRSVVKDVTELRDRARRNALNKDAMDEPNAKFKPPGSWTLSRGTNTGRDRGSRRSFTG